MGSSIRANGLAVLLGDGSSVTPTCFVDPLPGSLSVDAAYAYEQREGYAAAKGMQTHPRDLLTATFAVPFQSYVYYDGLGILFKSALGDVATTGPSGSDYTHTYSKLNDPAATTVEVVYSDDLANSRTMTGARCASWTIECPLNERVRMSLSYLGLNLAAETTHTALSDRTDRVIVHTNECTVLTLNAVDLLATGTVRGLTITGENALEARYGFGSAKPNAIYGTSNGTITATLTVHVDSDTYNDYRTLHEAGTEVTLVATFTAASGETLTITLRGAIVGEPAEPVGADRGAIELSINLKCRQTSSADAITVVVVNEVSSAVAN